jgi:RNA polymerase sigma-70 factor (ECF subfamily)
MDQAAFRSFYQRTAPALRAYIARSVGSIHAADDILQDVFMRFLLKAPSKLDEPAMRGYLYRTAETLMVDRWRQRQRETARDLAAAELREETVHLDSVGADIGRAFRELKPQQRSLLWMAYVEGFDHGEIAVAAGLKERSVRVLLSRARKAFAGVLTRFGLRPEAAHAE